MRRALWALLIVPCLLLGHAMQRVAERGRFAAPYSTYGAGPDGTRALLLLAQKLGHDARPFTRELSHLPRGTLVLVAGCKTELLRKVARPEREALTRWVEAGGLLIVAGVADLVPDAAGLSTADERPCQDTPQDVELDVSAAGPPLAHLLSFKVHGALPLREDTDAEATELLSSVAGPLALTVPLGRGRVVLLGIPDALTNQQVSNGGGLVFARLLAFAPPGPVLFDEYHLGMGERRSVIGYLRDAGYAPLLVQLLLAVLCWLIAGSIRLAPAAPPPPAQHGPRRSFVSALAQLTMRTRDHQGAAQALADAALHNIARKYGLPAGPALGARLAARGLHAVSVYVRRIEQQASAPLDQPLHVRAQAIERDETAALVIGETM